MLVVSPCVSAAAGGVGVVDWPALIVGIGHIAGGLGWDAHAAFAWIDIAPFLVAPSWGATRLVGLAFGMAVQLPGVALSSSVSRKIHLLAVNVDLHGAWL